MEFDTPQAFRAFIASKMRRLRKLPEDVLAELPDQATEMARTILESDAAARPNSNPELGGRQQTGWMVDHLTNWVTSQKPGEHKWVAVGWRHEDFTQFRTWNYPMIQDTGDPGHPPSVTNAPGAGGFYNVKSDSYIPSVGALDYAGIWLREQIVAEMRKAVEDSHDD